MIEHIQTDILVIGAGGAGLRAAIEARQLQKQVLLLGKEVLGCAHTGMAMGGMNAAVAKPATPEFHAEITMDGGYFINNPRLVKAFTDEMPARVYDLESYGVIFDRKEDGEFYVWSGPKQKYPLNVCVGDYTGREMMQGLVDQARKLNVKYTDKFFVSKLLVSSGRVVGAVGIHLKTGQFVVFEAGAVILATGGAGRMYEVTTNAASNTGDGYAMALDVGAQLVDMEMIQFHPTGMAYPPSSRGVLVTEKTRSHGGILLNKDGDRFMKKYYPKEMEVAKRDEVSRSIYQEVASGFGNEHKAVYLSVTHIPKEKILEYIPDVYEQYKATGVDITREPMEIYPSMHHVMGGINIDEWGRSSIPGLYAAGEVVGGIHGANRLGGNSIAEGQVFGRRAAITAAQEMGGKREKLADAVVASEQARIEGYLTRKDGIPPQVVEHKLKKTMWDLVGIFRDEKGLTQAKEQVAEHMKEAGQMKARTSQKHRNRDLQDCLEVINMLTTAQVVIEAALIRKESRGAHSRTDYPTMLEDWKKNIVITKQSGVVKADVRPVITL